MVIGSPQRIGLFPFQMAFLWLINGGDPHHLQVPAMILQVGQLMTQTNDVTGPERELTRKNLIRQGLANWKRPQKIWGSKKLQGGTQNKFYVIYEKNPNGLGYIGELY